MKKSLLEIEDLELNFYTYEGVVEALDGVELELREGETLGLVGETGCGKSVTGLSTLILVPTPGKIEGGKIIFQRKDTRYNLLDQKDAFLRSIRGKDISMIFQDPRSALNPVYTIGDQIMEVLMHHRKAAIIKEVLQQKILIQTEGTIIMHKNANGHTREEIVKQVHDGKDSSLYDWKNSIPIGNAIRKLQKWKKPGVKILYLTSQTKPTEVEDVKSVLKKYNFPDGQLLFRQKGEEYKDVVERVMPDILVEDDHESFGGKDEMIYAHIKPELKKRIKLYTVKEFGGVDHLPDDVGLGRIERNLYIRMLINPKALTTRILSKFPIVNRFKQKMRNMAKEEAINILRAMRIPDPERVIDMYPHELSGGMAQRAVIAMALSCSPTLLLADEPTTNLDVTVQLQILHLIRELKKEFGSTILYVTHDMGVIAELCDRVAVMYAGSVVESAEVVELFKNPLHPYTEALLESIPRAGHEFKSIEGIVPSLINPPKGCRFHDRCPYAMEICTKAKPKMIEVKEEHFVECYLHSKGFQ